jgi:D-alanyl-D-alanine carboxypeptidase/D-alanyl-D-alanine-endopeptidase (penicillin-binding protein 4)
MRRHPGVVLPLSLLFATSPAFAEPSADGLARAIDRVVARPAFRPAFWGIVVRSLKTDRVLYARDPEKNFRPASTLKLVVSAAALDAFGPDARLRTTVETAGRLDGRGRILGDVYLVGRGDPNLSARFNPGRPAAAFEELADALRAAGVQRIEGRLVGHEGAFTGDRRGSDWGWEDLVWSYGAEVSALSFNDNVAELRLLPGEQPGDPAFLEASPLTSYYSVVSTALTSPAGAKAELKLERDLGTNRIRLTGTIPVGDTWEGRPAVEDPARYAATVFGEALQARGIRVMGAVVTSSDPLPPRSRVLAAHDSPPLSEMLKVVNKESQNLHTEMLLRLLGQRAKGEGSVAAGHDAVREFLARIGVRSESWGLQDGSGLSRADLVDPRGLVDLLVAMDRHPQAAVFRDSLAVMGVDGTLKDRLRRTPAEGKVLAKTGTLRLSNALAGYATAASGERVVFAILVNNHTGPSREAVAAIDEIARALVAR